MNALESFQEVEGYARYRPVKECSLQEAIDLVCAAVAFARDHQIKKLLVDTTELTGFSPPNTWQRFQMGEKIAKEAQSAVKLAVLARLEMIDVRHFGITVARNRGLTAEVFDAEADALAWLLDAQTR